MSYGTTKTLGSFLASVAGFLPGREVLTSPSKIG